MGDCVEFTKHALAALKELEADHRAGKISDEDYRAVVGALRLVTKTHTQDFHTGQTLKD
jgi:hypothetical protein